MVKNEIVLLDPYSNARWGGVLHICHTSLPLGKHKLPKMRDLMLFLLFCVGRLSAMYFE